MNLIYIQSVSSYAIPGTSHAFDVFDGIIRRRTMCKTYAWKKRFTIAVFVVVFVQRIRANQHSAAGARLRRRLHGYEHRGVVEAIC